MKDPYFQADSLVEISGNYIDADNRDEALVLLTRAEEILGEIVPGVKNSRIFL